MSRLQDKVAVITGGNSGIGKGIAECFIREGAKVVIFGRDAETLFNAKKELGENILTVQGDVTSKKDLEKLYRQTHDSFGNIDILVANSGIGARKHISAVSEEDFDSMVNINYKGLYFTVRYALDYLNPNASIILMASIAAHASIKNHSIYASTKASVVKLAKNLAYDLGNRGIRVNSISPGYIETPIFDDRLKADPTYLTRRIERIPLGRIGTPEDIGKAAVFLGSEDASYITGADLIIDGGYIAAFNEVE